ncbi:MAG: FAD-dependent oxidoreductase [Parasphingorhabdus sp.]|uniref:FAD-dependent oxidoreductase n=1 Tax=Parasphingorhabdus sp. TaxID=2709688 RepID=UPI003299723B
MTQAKEQADYDAIVIGGGFYGCCLALFLASKSDRVALIEAGSDIMGRASRVNQARVHTGFHYPRSFVTALRSKALQSRFAKDFPDAIIDDFSMIYAIARRRSKVSARRFHRMYSDMNAPISVVKPQQEALFNNELVEQAFLCQEFAFDWTKLRDQLRARLDEAGIDILLDERVENVSSQESGVRIHLAGERSFLASNAFNVTYANINNLLINSGLAPIELRYELAELALVTPPDEFADLAVTIMDGPFWSCMPYPSEKLHSLTHVRYTPHHSWTDSESGTSPDVHLRDMPKDSRWRHMINDAQRYMPCFEQARYEKSLFDIKAVLVKNERDDGRPILFHRHSDAPDLISIMGAKIDNIYDFFEMLPQIDPKWEGANLSRLFPQNPS